jgi:hypothetical protein
VALAPVDGLSPAAQLQYRLRAPKAVVAGDTMVVGLMVHNPTGHSIALQPCPNYELRLTGSGSSPAVDARALNCRAAPTVAAGASVTFELHLPVSADFTSGAAALEWRDTTTDFPTLFGDVVDVLPPCENGDTPARDYIGLTMDQAQQRVERTYGRSLRLVWRDGSDLPRTLDLVPGRIDLYVRSDVIEQACRE